MKLLVHIGMGKTGTSAIQSFLDHEHNYISSFGFFHAGTRLQNVLEDTPIVNQGDVGKVDNLEKALTRLEDKLLKKKPEIDVLVWSNEAFSMGYDFGKASKVFSSYVERSSLFHELEFLVVLRRQDEWVESAYKQWALKHKTNKERRVMSPSEFVKNNSRLLDFNSLVDQWDVEGATLKVVSYDEVKSAGGMVGFFCSHFGVPYKEAFDKYQSVHESLGNSLSKFVSLYNRGREGEVLPEVFMRVIADAKIEELPGNDGSFVGHEIKLKLYEEYKEENRRLSKRVLGRDGFFSDKPVAQSKEFVFDAETYITYLAMICQNHQRRIDSLNRRLHDIESLEPNKKNEDDSGGKLKKLLNFLKMTKRV